MEGRTAIDCLVPHTDGRNELLRYDDAFETPFCARFTHLLPEEDHRRPETP